MQDDLRDLHGSLILIQVMQSEWVQSIFIKISTIKFMLNYYNKRLTFSVVVASFGNFYIH